MTIGEKLTELRTELGLSTTYVADEVGVTKQAIFNYENNIRVPRDEIKIKLANLYNTTVENIFFNQESNV